MCLDHDSVGRDELPALGVRLEEDLDGCRMVGVVGRVQGEEAARVDEDVLHRSLRLGA